MPRYIKDSTMSNYINRLKEGTRYRESGLVHCPRSRRSYTFFAVRSRTPRQLQHETELHTCADKFSLVWGLCGERVK